MATLVVPVLPTTPAASISASVGKGGKNVAADVATVQLLLIAAGAQLTVTGNADAATLEAIYWYQLNWTAYPDSKVDPGGKTWKNLAAKTMKIVEKFVQLPQSGTGFYSYASSSKQYGTPKCIATAKAVALAVNAKLSVNIGIGEMSQQNPGNFGPHKTHYKGRAIDIRPLRTDGAESPCTHTDSTYSRERTKALVEALRSDSNVRQILFNDSEIPGVTHCVNHDNHLHVDTYE